MKLVVPITSDEDILPLVHAGADEFYCGISTDEFADLQGFTVWNKRPDMFMNFKSFDVLKKAIDLAHDNGKKVFLTVNSLGYVESYYIYLEKVITTAYKMGINGFIVSDIGIINLIKKLNLKCELHISTTAVVYNSEAVKFYKKLGATRIIFPRHIDIAEMTSVSQKDTEMQYEIFMMNSRCPNEDGLCTIEHIINSRNKIYGCFFLQNFKVYDPDHGESENKNYCKFIRNACGACIIPKISRTPIEYLKIVGRECPLPKRIADCVFLKSVINFQNNFDGSPDATSDKIREIYEKIYKKSCERSCYYKEKA